MTSLFDPISLRGLTIRNRIFLPPMCMYRVEAKDGVPTDWHLAHYGSRAAGGFGLVVAEATGVSPEGRITPWCCGIWNDEQAGAWERIAALAHQEGAAFAIQLQHAGRKGSFYRDFDVPASGSVPLSDGGWETIGPSPIPFPGIAAPRAASLDDIAKVRADFVAAAKRADAAGVDAVQLHAAHGYLLFEFLSPLSNQRTDQYGGSFEGRTRLLLEVAEDVREVWPDNKPLLVRLSATEWVDGGWTVEESVELARLLKDRGVDMIDVSSGGNVLAPIPKDVDYQIPLAAAVRKAGLPVSAVGRITEARQAQSILDEGLADAVSVGRAALRDPHWPLRTGAELGVPRDNLPYSKSYLRGRF
ncbi:MAG: NADH:flavin oxidoreductase/NADH oxidase [Propionibacteriaceae bacterium]|jgi:2,4-dienoyl-CoA reductase-like NADH-dependent reductase (Old Yellow Enzyme family)|nr:NADH:flavin oxidoreductase/NADH oxidase [Propionibacteriaceae bacterium]